jgi:hypothetical protein
MGAVCAMGSTAYARWLAGAMPHVNLRLIPGSTDEMVRAVDNGLCDGIVDVWPNTQAAASNVRAMRPITHALPTP